MTNEECMRRAIALSEQNIENGGGPFAAVIVKDGEIIAEAASLPTATRLPMRKSVQSARRARFSIHSPSQAARFLLRASRARCAWARFTGRT